jgi:hypothetical protein
MAYATKELTAQIRQDLEAQFPRRQGWKFSVTLDNHSSVNVAVMEAPVTFLPEGDGYSVNYRWLGQRGHEYDNVEILKRIVAIANKTNYDRSEPMTDYFDVGFYFDLSVGKWDKPFQVNLGDGTFQAPKVVEVEAGFYQKVKITDCRCIGGEILVENWYGRYIGLVQDYNPYDESAGETKTPNGKLVPKILGEYLLWDASSTEHLCREAVTAQHVCDVWNEAITNSN